MLKSTTDKKLFVREWIFPVLYFSFALFFEVINFVTLKLGVLPTYFLFDMAVFLLFLGILSLFKTGDKWWIVVASLFLLIQVVLNITNATLFKVFGDVFSVSMLSLGREGKNAFKPDFLDYRSIAVNLLFWAMFIAICIFLDKKTEQSNTLPKQSRLMLIFTFFIVFQSCGFGLFKLQIEGVKVYAQNEETVGSTIDDERMWNNMFLKSVSLQKFGTYGFYIKNFGDYISDDKKESPKDTQRIADAVSVGKNYFASSQYSGIGKGDNLIIIMLESFDTFSIDPIYTPFLWNMKTGNYAGAQYMSSFYARNKTNISEEISLLSHIANNKLFSSYFHSVGLDMPYSLPNLMKNNGATSVNYFHGYLKEFYDRVNVNKALGFDNVYALEDYTLGDKSKEWNDWILDSNYIESMSNKFIPSSERFFSFYTTIATHGDYDYENYRIQDNLRYVEDNFDRYLNYVQTETNFVMPTNPKLLAKYKQFKAFTMDTDKMIQNVFETLQTKNLLKNTTVVLFADHNAYYDDMCYKIKGISKDDYSNIEGNHLPCIIFNDGLPAKVNDTYCSTYDIFPTICDLLGLSYNESLAQGYSVFSDDIQNTLFVSSLSGMYVKNIFTTNLEDFYALDDSVTQEDVEKFRDNLLKYYNKQEIIELIYRHNYFGNYAK